jgi:predicted dehydrogenase
LGVPKACASYETLVEDGDVDVVYVATPHAAHAENCHLCLDSGKHVLCEKPFAINAREAREVVEHARRKKLFCMEAMRMRFLPTFIASMSSIDKGCIGGVEMITADFSIPVRFETDNRLFDPKLGGGALLDRGVYGISLAVRLLGELLDVASYASKTSTGVDEKTVACLRNSSGQVAVITAGLRTRGSNEAIVMGQRGTIRIHEPFYRAHRTSMWEFTDTSDARGGKSTLKEAIRRVEARVPHVRRLRLKMGKWAIRANHVTTRPFDGNGYQFEAAEVIRCLRAGQLESEIMPLEETIRVMETMDRIRSQCELSYPQD